MKRKYGSAILSVFVWGSGQFFVCRQKAKGLLFFLVQVLFFGIELNSGYWFNYFAGEIPNFQVRVHGGFFTKGLWGLYTLGEVPGVMGDHSTMLLITGIIALFALIVFLAIYIWNITDAYKMGKLIDETNSFLSSGDYGKHLYKKMFPYIVLSPIALLLLFVMVMPIVFSVLTAFTNYNANHLPPANLVSWVGIQNFVKVASTPVWSSTFLAVFGWTILWSFAATFSTYFLGLFQALILNSDCVKHKSFFRSIYILPWAIPVMVSLLMFRNLLNGQFGPLNQFLISHGIISSQINFLTDYAKASVIFVNLWIGFPAFMVMLQGVLSNQDTSLYEAARIDGANPLQVFARIKLPLLMKATAPLIVMNVSFNFNSFSNIYFLTNGGPSNPAYQIAGDTDILISWIYKLTLNQKMYSLAAVMNILIFIFVAVVSYWNFKRTTSFKEM